MSNPLCTCTAIQVRCYSARCNTNMEQKAAGHHRWDLCSHTSFPLSHESIAIGGWHCTATPWHSPEGWSRLSKENKQWKEGISHNWQGGMRYKKMVQKEFRQESCGVKVPGNEVIEKWQNRWKNFWARDLCSPLPYTPVHSRASDFLWICFGPSKYIGTHEQP